MFLQKILAPPGRRARYAVVIAAFAAYIWVFARFHHEYGTALTSLAIFPVIIGSWYFGVSGGIVTALLSIGTDFAYLLLDGHPLSELIEGTGYVIGNSILVFVALIVGRLATILRERNDALLRLERLEEERRDYTELLESLNETTRIALEARDLTSALEILLERTSQLFKADDGYLVLWDEAEQRPIPFLAYGSMKDVFPRMQIEVGESFLSIHVLELGRPLAIPDVKNYEHANPRLAVRFPARSALGLPLVSRDRKLGILFLGYRQPRAFDQTEIVHADIVARQIALILTKIQLLEQAQKQVKELTILHEVATIATQAGTLDELIERVTDVIGRNLFPDNFGIMLMHNERNMLKPHPSYRFVNRAKGSLPNVPIGEGVSGQVAQTGVPIRVGNIRELDNYLDIDPETVSELCVPIRIKEQILGVINTESSKPNAFTADDEILLGTLAGQLATAIEQLRAEEAERKWLEQLARSNDLIYSLAHITTHIEKALDTDGIVQTLGEELLKIGLVCAAAFYNEKKSGFTFAYTSMPPQTLEQFENGIGFSFINYSFSFDLLRAAIEADNLYQPAVVDDPRNEMRIFFPQERGGMDLANVLEEVGIGDGTELMRLPLMFEEQLLGILWVWGKAITKADLPVMSIFAKQIGISLERARLFAEVQSLALTDPLTGLRNRRSLFDLGKIEFSRAHRMKRPFCCMMLDLDHFKKVNDNFGHQAGDAVLREFARCCQKSVREMDLLGRYGGEELLVFLPETDLKTAVQVAERLRKTIADHPIRVNFQELTLTVSIGVAQLDENTLELETLIARADQAMYIAKYRGRNRVAVSK